jgi:hypothetical protein
MLYFLMGLFLGRFRSGYKQKMAAVLTAATNYEL